MRFRAQTSLRDHADRMRQWGTITRVFYLSGQQLLNTISLALLRAHEENDSSVIARLEQIRNKVDDILADDGGHCRPLMGAEELP